MPEKNGAPKYPEGEARGDRGLQSPSKRASLLRKIVSPNISENGAPLLHYKKQE